MSSFDVNQKSENLSDDDSPELILDVDNLQEALDAAFQEMDLGFQCAQALAFLATQTTSLECMYLKEVKKETYRKQVFVYKIINNNATLLI